MWKSKIDSFYSKIKKVNTICATLSGLVLLFVTFSIFVDVFLRYFFNKPSIWVTEISSYLFLYVIFLATAYTLQQGIHIRVTFISGYLGKKTKHILDLLTSTLAILFCFVLLWQTSAMSWSAFKEHWTSPTMLGVPSLYVYLAMVAGSFLLLATFILQTVVQFISTDSEISGE